MTSGESVAVRLDMPMEDAERVSELLLRVPSDVADALRDQIWMVSVFVEHRKRMGVSERERFTERANRILEQLDPQEELGELAEFARLLSDPEACMGALPEAERSEYERCQQSVVRARHEAGREGREVWL